MCQEKFVQIYTKTFGGKIWSNLHRVSPDNFLDKNSKWLPLKISAKIWTNITWYKTFLSKNCLPNSNLLSSNVKYWPISLFSRFGSKVLYQVVWLQFFSPVLTQHKQIAKYRVYFSGFGFPDLNIYIKLVMKRQLWSSRKS